MTTDPFTTTAEAQADKRWPHGHVARSPLNGPEKRNRKTGFVLGAAWARDHLARQEPTDAEVDAAARTWAENGPTPASWYGMSRRNQDRTRERMRLALNATRRTAAKDARA